MSYYAVDKKLYPKDILKVSGKDIKVVSGGELQNLYTNQVNYKVEKPEIQFFTVPGNDKVEFQFLVEGKGEVNFIYNSQKAGTVSAKERLK